MRFFRSPIRFQCLFKGFLYLFKAFVKEKDRDKVFWKGLLSSLVRPFKGVFKGLPDHEMFALSKGIQLASFAKEPKYI